MKHVTVLGQVMGGGHKVTADWVLRAPSRKVYVQSAFATQ